MFDRSNSRTGERSRARGRTVHVRPIVPGPDAGNGPGWARIRAKDRKRRRGGPVAGCMPGACHHVRPHSGHETPAGKAVWGS